MKKLLTIIFLLTCAVASGQQKVDDVVDDDYVRSSISTIVVNRGDGFDARIFNAVRSMSLGEKFDINNIPTDRILIRTSRSRAVDADQITSLLDREEVGKEIVSFWYRRNGQGEMSDELILKRGMYSLRDQEILNSKVTKVGISALGEKGYDLVDGSYVLVLDYYDVYENHKDEIYRINVDAFIYKLNYTEELVEQVYDAWIYEDDTPQVRAQKNALFESITFPLEYVTTVEAQGTSNSSIADAAISAYDNAFYRSEKAVDQWRVTSSIISTRPIKAKIGTKEGLKNGQRLQVYKIVEERDGDLDSRKVGYVRAADVVNNSHVATGQMGASSFYQISGGNVEEGMILKQKNDLKLGVTVAGAIGGYAPFELGLEYLEHINAKGTSRYLMLNLGVDAYSSESFYDAVAYVNLGLGAGIAFRPIRPIEIMPLVQLGMEVLSVSSVSIQNNDSMDWATWFAKAGARISWQVIYPVQIFAQANAAVKFADGIWYKYYNDILLQEGRGHKPAVTGFSFGVKVNF